MLMLNSKVLPAEHASRHLEQAAQQLKSLSYDELAKLAEAQCHDPDLFSRFEECEGTEVYIDTTIVKLGRLRKRVGVEMVLTAGDEVDSGRVTLCAYFERYASGRLYQASGTRSIRGLVRALALAVGYVVLLAVVVCGVGAALWYLVGLLADR